MVREVAVVPFSIVVIVATGSIIDYSYTFTSDVEKERSMSERTIEQIQEEHTEKWMAIPGIVGTAIGLFEGRPCIKIFTSRKEKQLRAKIPMTIEGYPVIIEETGTFRALDHQ